MRIDTTARLGPGLVLALLLASCASGPERPDRDLTRAESAIEQAEQVGARQYGPLPLDNAREKLALARAAVAEEEMLVAQRYAEEATLAADLAAAKARRGKAERAVDQLEKSIAVLREEIARTERLEGETG